MLFDSHCHLDFPEFAVGINTHLNQAQANGVTDILVPGVAANEWSRVLHACQLIHPVRRHIALGLHPCFLQQHDIDQNLLELETHLKQRDDVVAVGECGLDLFIENPQLDTQQALFDAQLELASAFDLPVVLHVRRAVDLITQRLKRHRLRRGGIAHAFSGSQQQADNLVALGFLIGVGGAVTYERANRLRKVVCSLPVTSLALETDAPDMPLRGYQGMPNHPSRVAEVAATVADLRGESAEFIAQKTHHNVTAILGL
jgi:TatD DNase family protein